MAIPEDPYFAGRVLAKAAPTKRLGPVPKPPVLAWVAVYAINLIIPLQFAWPLTSDAGRMGMLFGVLLLLAIGCRVCFLSRRIVMTLVYGGWIVAASQFMPFLHVIAGLIGMTAARATGQATMRHSEEVGSELGGFIATVMTGGILLTVAFVLGLVVQWIKSSSHHEATAIAYADQRETTAT